jgi:hypothetical protein
MKVALVRYRYSFHGGGASGHHRFGVGSGKWQ